MSNLLKGRMGGVGEVHWLLAYSPYVSWGSTHCKSWEGGVELAKDNEEVNCRKCKVLDPLKLETVEESDEE